MLHSRKRRKKLTCNITWKSAKLSRSLSTHKRLGLCSKKNLILPRKRSAILSANWFVRNFSQIAVSLNLMKEMKNSRKQSICSKNGWIQQENKLNPSSKVLKKYSINPKIRSKTSLNIVLTMPYKRLKILFLTIINQSIQLIYKTTQNWSSFLINWLQAITLTSSLNILSKQFYRFSTDASQKRVRSIIKEHSSNYSWILSVMQLVRNTISIKIKSHLSTIFLQENSIRLIPSSILTSLLLGFNSSQTNTLCLLCLRSTSIGMFTMS